MLWSGSSPLTVVRDGMWGFLLLSGAAWLAIAWSVLRLEPADLVAVAGPVLLFGAVTEAVRALAGTRTWWLNAGMAVLFATTGVIMLRDDGSSWTTPAALIGWYLIVRGAVDIAIAMLSRESDRIWGLLMVVGVLETGLGFFASSAFVRTPELVIVVLGGAALIRGVADLVASLRLREASVAHHAGRLLEPSPQRAIGVAGYAAGLTDFESELQGRAAGPRHRATPRVPAIPEPASAPVRRQARLPQEQGVPGGGGHDEVLRTTADLDAMLALAGVTGAAVPGAAMPDVTIPEATGRGTTMLNAAARATTLQDATILGATTPDATVPGAAARGRAGQWFEVPDTAEGPESQDPQAATPASRQTAPAPSDEPLPPLHPAARMSRAARPSMDDTSVIARGRRVD